ncbi:MAG: protein kinase domain-containing protein [Gemmataceae bacterium]
MIGARLGKWVLDSELGRGGMGQVFLAYADPPDTGGPRQAAVKVLTAELAIDEGFLLRFQREIDALSQLNHPQIVRFFESGQAEGHYFYAMEFVAGPSLEQRLHELGRLPWQEVLTLALALCPALKHAHDRGVIHRDLKPGNILLDPVPDAHSSSLAQKRWTPKITDFGIAHVFARPHLTVTGGIIGTAEYLSPEQAAGKPVTKRSDLYSLGVVLYTLLTGRTPFRGEVMEILHKHRFGQYEQVRRLVPEVPYDMEEIVVQLLEKDPEHRPGDAMILHKQLDRVSRKEERKATQIVSRDTEDLLPPHLRKGGPDNPGPATLMSQLMRQELERQNRGGPVARFLNRPVVLIGLLLACIGLIAWGLWPASAESLFRKAAPLMASDDPEDWSRAVNYLDKLENRYPNHAYDRQIQEFHQKVQDYKEERRIANGQPVASRLSEAQWFYYQGLRARQQGDEARAKKWWTQLVLSFADIPSEQAWVHSAERELAKIEEVTPPLEKRWDSVRAALKRARELKQAGKPAEAKAIYEGLHDLYHDDPSAKEILAEIDREKLE